MNLYPVGKAATYLLVRVMFRMRYEEIQNIPRDQGFIIACNHRSNWDPLFIAHKVPGQLFFMAKVELFKNRFIGWLLSSFGAFPIDRGKGDTGAMEYATGLLREGGILAIFPEGHRSKDGKPLRARSGIGMVASQTGADVLPCAVIYGEKLGFRTTVTVRYGKLIHHEDLQVSATSPSSIRTASKRVMDDIVALLNRDQPAEPTEAGREEA